MKKRLVTIVLTLIMAVSMMSVAPVQTQANTSGTSSFMLKGTAGARKISYSWTRVSGASKYKLYCSSCDGKTTTYKCVKTTTANKFVKTKLKTGKEYKAYVAAYNKSGKIIAKSIVSHVQVKGGKKSNATKVTATGSLSLKEKATATIKASISKKDGNKTLLYHKHCRKIRYYSGNKSVATVTTAGKVTAVAAGTTYIYAVAPTGAYAKTKVTVTAEKKTVTIKLDCYFMQFYIFGSGAFGSGINGTSMSIEDFIYPIQLDETTFEDLIKNGKEYTIDTSKTLEKLNKVYPYAGFDKMNLDVKVTFKSGRIDQNLFDTVVDTKGNKFDQSKNYLCATITVKNGEGDSDSIHCNVFIPDSSIHKNGSLIHEKPGNPIVPEGSIKDGEIWMSIDSVS